jgi:hypothetical protein
MNALEGLRQAIDRQQTHLRATVPADREAAVLALLCARDQRQRSSGSEPAPDLVTGRRLADLGGNKALQLCLEAAEVDVTAPAASAIDDLGNWADSFLDACGQLAEAELVLGHRETGFMRLVEEGDGSFAAWIATKRPPTSWRERADVDWWATLLEKRHEGELEVLRSARPESGCGDYRDDEWYRRLAGVHLEMMAYQFAYPPAAEIGGLAIQTYRDILSRLIARALQARDRGEAPAACSERTLIAALAAELALDPAVVGRAVAGFTLDREGAANHAAVPGIAAAPLVRVGPDRLVWSILGLTTEPLLFLARELRRRDAQAYHNAAYLREVAFRQDLYSLFPEKRFVTSAGRLQLRREAGDLRTDIDAVVFDRKTGTLSLFELKAQDPFARSIAELARQRDNVLHANRQLSGVLDWLRRHGADELLNRVDARTAKTFRAQKIYPFVLGRYLVHFDGGPDPDRRAAWGTWPQVLRLVDGQPFRANDANPLATLFTRLRQDVPLLRLPKDAPPREIPLGEIRLVVLPRPGSAGAEPNPR